MSQKASCTNRLPSETYSVAKPAEVLNGIETAERAGYCTHHNRGRRSRVRNDGYSCHISNSIESKSYISSVRQSSRKATLGRVQATWGLFGGKWRGM